MISFETRAVLLLAVAYRKYEDSVPDIGMAPPDSLYIKQAIHDLGLIVPNEEITKLTLPPRKR